MRDRLVIGNNHPREYGVEALGQRLGGEEGGRPSVNASAGTESHAEQEMVKYYKNFSLIGIPNGASVHSSRIRFRMVPKRLSNKKMDARNRIHLFVKLSFTLS